MNPRRARILLCLPPVRRRKQDWTPTGTHFNNRVMLRATVVLAFALVLSPSLAGEAPFAQRGYYMTFMRMPAFGLPEWRQMVDCIEEDGGNLLMLWTAGGFRSRKFPQTWEYNRDHKNVANDFVRELI